MIACASYFDGNWAGGSKTLGANDDAVGLPTATWSLKNFSLDDYNELFAGLKSGSVVVDRNYETGMAGTFANVNLTII